jgi:hypothetical protein
MSSSIGWIVFNGSLSMRETTILIDIKISSGSLSQGKIAEAQDLLPLR